MRKRVVITGMGTVNPLGNNVVATWELAKNGRSGVAPIQLFDASEFKTQIAAEVKEFDPVERFGRKEARHMDRVAHLGLAAAQEAVADAKIESLSEDVRRKIGAILGSGLGGMWAITDGLQTLITKGPKRVSPFLVPMGLPDTVPGMISINYGFCGPNLSIATACASSNNAIGEATRVIQRGDADIMIAGGSEAGVLPLTVSGFNAMGALSTRNDEPETACRPFDATRDGFVPGEGAAILVLEELEHAKARGAYIYGEIIGYGTSADGFHISAPHPEGAGAIQSMRMALTDAGLQPGEIEYINAHGTGTLLNDAGETAAIKTTFGEAAYDIPISSTKSMHGHLMGSGSALEAVISIKGMEVGIVPPTINYQTPDPECDLDYVPNTARAVSFKNFMSNGFGFGGHNATIIVGKYES